MTLDGTKYPDLLLGVSYAPGFLDVTLNVKLSNGEEVELNLQSRDAARLYLELKSVVETARRP